MHKWGKNISNNCIPLVGQSRQSRVTNRQTLVPPPNIIPKPNQLTISHYQTNMRKKQRIKLDDLPPKQEHDEVIPPIWIHLIFIANNGLSKTIIIIKKTSTTISQTTPNSSPLDSQSLTLHTLLDGKQAPSSPNDPFFPYNLLTRSHADISPKPKQPYEAF